jgi:hypothetical protein
MFSPQTLITRTLQNKAPRDKLAKIKHGYIHVIREPNLGHTHVHTRQHQIIPSSTPHSNGHITKKHQKSFIGFLADVLISYVSGDPKVA